jgi:hypothetical protein
MSLFKLATYPDLYFVLLGHENCGLGQMNVAYQQNQGEEEARPRRRNKSKLGRPYMALRLGRSGPLQDL